MPREREIGHCGGCLATVWRVPQANVLDERAWFAGLAARAGAGAATNEPPSPTTPVAVEQRTLYYDAAHELCLPMERPRCSSCGRELVWRLGDRTAYRLVRTAAHLFKRYYGDWPQRIGLDGSTRYQEYVAQFGHTYTRVERDPLTLLPTLRPWECHEGEEFVELGARAGRRVEIEIAPLLFTRPRPGAPFLLDADPHPETVWCAWGKTLVFMDIWWTVRGQHSIVWGEAEYIPPDE